MSLMTGGCANYIPIVFCREVFAQRQRLGLWGGTVLQHLFARKTRAVHGAYLHWCDVAVRKSSGTVDTHLRPSGSTFVQSRLDHVAVAYSNSIETDQQAQAVT